MVVKQLVGEKNMKLHISVKIRSLYLGSKSEFDICTRSNRETFYEVLASEYLSADDKRGTKT